MRRSTKKNHKSHRTFFFLTFFLSFFPSIELKKRANNRRISFFSYFLLFFYKRRKRIETVIHFSYLLFPFLNLFFIHYNVYPYLRQPNAMFALCLGISNFICLFLTLHLRLIPANEIEKINRQHHHLHHI